jgi:4a-hydroxytetrahydrobiopterin dehydratase
MSAEEIDVALVDRPGWERRGDTLVRELQMRDFDDAWQLVGRIATGAEDYKRRPDLCISEYNVVRITIANPHHAGITLAEVRLAAKVDALVAGPQSPAPA